MSRNQHRAKGRKTRPTPWPLRRLEPTASLARDRIANRVPARSGGLVLEELSSLLRMDSLVLRQTGIQRAPALPVGDVVSIALADPAEDHTRGAVLTLPLDLARHLVDAALSRGPSALRTPLTSGEQGAFLFVLDRAAKDWLDAGGPGFSIKGLLADADQIPDYLGGAATWRVSAKIVNNELESHLALYFKDPIPPCSPRAPKAGIAKVAARWPVSLVISIGRSQVLLEEIRNLDAADCIVLDEGCHPLIEPASAAVVLSCGGWSRTGRWLDPRRIEIVTGDDQGVPMETKSQDKQEIAATLEPARDARAADMEVVVRVEIGQVRLTVDQATNLAPGRVLRLSREVGPEVDLKVGDKLIGRGEMVDCEGSLAVEVTEVT